MKTLIGKNYDLKLTQSIQNLLSKIDKQYPKVSDYIEEFYELIQARVDPHLESIWVYAALTFRSRNHRKDDPLDRVSAAEDLFQLLSMCSASCGSGGLQRWSCSKLDGKKVDDELLFYIDNKGEDEHKDEEDAKVNRSTNAPFVDAAHTMTSSEKRGRKRKGKNAEKKEKIKFVKYDHLNSDSTGGRPSLINNDSINSGSEAENPHSDEDTE